MENKETKFQADIEWEQRKLCRDESCIGVIGADGRCKECGLPFEEGPSDVTEEEPVMDDLEEAETEEEPVMDDLEEAETEEEPVMDDLEEAETEEEPVMDDLEEAETEEEPVMDDLEEAETEEEPVMDDLEEAETEEEPVMDDLEEAETEEESVMDDLEEAETEEELDDVEENGEEKFDLDLEWEQRKLCSDEGCIGVIGPDGRCKECGKPYNSE